MFVFVVPTYSCNLKCTYCMQESDRPKTTKLIDLDVFRKNLNTMFSEWPEYKEEFQTIRFHGGEFTISPIEYIEHLVRIWREEYTKVFDIDLITAPDITKVRSRDQAASKFNYITSVTNGVKLITDRDYLDRLLELRTGFAISYDLFSQPFARTPTLSTAKYEELFDYLLSRNLSVHLLSQISSHSLLHQEEYLQYLRYFIEKYSGKKVHIRLRAIEDYSFSKDQLRQSKESIKFYKKIQQVIADENLKGYALPIDYYYFSFDQGPSSFYASCSINSNGCWGNTMGSIGMVTYAEDAFWLGCIRANNAYKFTTRKEFEQRYIEYADNLERIRKEYCKGCKYQMNCSPCLFEFETGNRFYMNHNCRKVFSQMRRK